MYKGVLEVGTMAKITNFVKIKTAHDLISYLEDPKRDKDFFYHYTTIDRLQQIIKNRYFVFSGFEIMNDKQEAEIIGNDYSNNTFVGSFSRADNEVMAMWGMYAIPWEMGVRIGIPKAHFRKWIKETKSVFEFKEGSLKEEFIVDKTQKKINAVCYYDKLNNRLDWSNRRLHLKRLTNLLNPETNSQLYGYVKHKTWAYEEEMRVLIKVDSNRTIRQIGIPIPDYIINDLKLVLGPCFEITNLLNNDIPTIKSEFTGKVKPKKVCDICRHKFSLSPNGKEE